MLFFLYLNQGNDVKTEISSYVVSMIVKSAGGHSVTVDVAFIDGKC